jgi:short-chain fatty acids transporter
MQAVVNRITRLVSRYLPDAYVFAVILTFIVFILGMTVEGKSAGEMVEYWGNGFWNLLKFAMQMALMLILGHVIAISEPVQKLLSFSLKFVTNDLTAILFVTFAGIFASLFNWGFALVAFAILSKAVVKKRPNLSFGYLLACAYGGFLVWHGGLSGSTLLKIASPSGALSEILDNKAYTMADTFLSPLNLILIGAHLIMLPLLNLWLKPKNVSQTVIEESVEISIGGAETPAEKLENSKWLTALVVLLFGASLYQYFFVKSGPLNINSTNLLFFFIAFIVHKTPKRFLESFQQSVPSSAGIILQYSFYASIMGMMISSGLATSASQFFTRISTETTFPFFTYLSAGLVNMFVPSGGGQWAVQAPIVVPAANELGVPIVKAALAVAWGDAWTNMLQPFWMVPVLSIAGLKLKDIMAQCFIYFVFSGVVTSILFLTL